LVFSYCARKASVTETIQALLASGEVVDDKLALTADEIWRKGSLTTQILVG